jgi:hypothetical protein
MFGLQAFDAGVNKSRRMQFEKEVPHPPGTNGVQFHRKQFLAERVGWLAMTLYLAWALLGGFGDGWISRKQAANQAQSCVVDYQRYGRRDAPFELRLRLQLDAQKDRLSLHLNREFVERVNIDHATPAYHSMQADALGVTLVFIVAPKPDEHMVTIEYTPEHTGALHGVVRPAEGGEVAFDQFIYP